MDKAQAAVAPVEARPGLWVVHAMHRDLRRMPKRVGADDVVIDLSADLAQVSQVANTLDPEVALVCVKRHSGALWDLVDVVAELVRHTNAEVRVVPIGVAEAEIVAALAPIPAEAYTMTGPVSYVPDEADRAFRERRPLCGVCGMRGAGGRVCRADEAPCALMARVKSSPKAGAARRSSAPRGRSRALSAALPPSDPFREALWLEGARKADIPAERVAIRVVHRKRIDEIVRRTGLDQQAVLNRAIATAWEALQMSGGSLSGALAKLRKQRSPAGASVSLRPTIATRRILREAAHPQARSILLQTGLNLWGKA